VTLWRISDHPKLDGIGGLMASGRWHTQGSLIVYCAPNPATSLVELLVHIEIDPDDLPKTVPYLEIEAPDDLSLETVDLTTLGRNWERNAPVTRHAGDEWLRSGRTALLRVPSAVVPATWNILINPRQPKSAAVRVVRTHRHGIDARLVR
jgi:RES domain-containing protein